MPRAPRKIALIGLLTLLFALFSGLGYWQLERRSWKLDLIERVEQQLAQTPVAAPGPNEWKQLTADDVYRPVTLTGQFLPEKHTRVQAMTAYGSGWWVLTPLKTERGFTVLVNRGFVDAEHRAAQQLDDASKTEKVTVTGLLRATEPEGRLFQENRPNEDRWYSRDVQAIARKNGLAADSLAPYFVDADAPPSGELRWPVGGLTVVQFRNAHLMYAITWFSLAGLCVAGIVIVLRRGPDNSPPDKSH